jgi:predicted  nucleic acid-binding Zn-ribbon protein
MSDDTTKDMRDARSFEERVLARFDAMDARFDVMNTRFDALDNRLTTLEEKVDRRLMETRPIWEAVQAQIRQLDKKFDLVIKDLYEMRVDVRSLDERVTKLESR